MSGRLSRRRFLSSSAATALLLTHPLSVLGYTHPGKAGREKIRVLSGDDELAQQIEKYLPHVDPAGPPATRHRHSIADIPALRRLIDNSSGQQLLGAVGSDLYPVLETLIRESGGAALFHGRHSVTVQGRSRHQFYTVPRTQGVADYFVTQLGSQSRVCQVGERCLGADEKVKTGDAPVVFAPDWFAAVAAIMIGIAYGKWQPGPVNQFSPAPGNDSLRAVAGIETFVFQL